MSGNLLDGLEALGLGNLSGMDIYGEEKRDNPVQAAMERKKTQETKEKDYLFDREINCPLCDSTFRAKAVRSSKVRPLAPDMDLRPRFQGIDTLKYDVLSCPICGYTALIKFFPTPLAVQKQKIREKICANFVPRNVEKEIYTYEDAEERYKLALVNAVVKGAKASEKAYICLKSAWILRGKAEELGEGHPDFIRTKEMEMDYLRNAYDGFIQAVATESFPMCGMDEQTVNYLVSVLALYTNHLDVASRMVAAILQSNVASSRLKDKARDVKEEILKRKKAMEEMD